MSWISTTSARWVFFASAAVVAVADQASKVIASATLGAERAVAGPVRLAIVHNSGGPFGIAPAASLVWVAASMVALTALTVAIPRGSPWVAVAGGAVLGGGAGNLADRLVRGSGLGRGAVVDWIAVDPYPRVFNLADVAIRLGALALIMAIVGRRRDRPAGVPTEAAVP
jgi:signal peptidase II